MIWAELPVNATVPPSGIKLPLLLQFPVTLTVVLVPESKVPLVMVKLFVFSVVVIPPIISE